MTTHLTIGMRRILPSVVLLFAGFGAFASHIIGTDLYYTHLTGSNYKITLVAYGDCGPLSAASFSTLPTSTPQICVYNGATPTATLVLTIDTPSSGTELAHFCPLDSSQCLSPTSVIPGVKKFTYSATYMVPTPSAVWRFVYSGNNGPGASAGRASAITNLTAAGATIMQLIDTLNNMTADNSNPILTVAQQNYFCNGTHDVYSPMPVDPDGDSLNISLVAATNGANACGSVGGPVTYMSPYTATAPLNVVSPDSFAFNALTGQITFNPLTQRAVIVYNIREFRSGVLIGTSQREMTVLSVNCGSCGPLGLTPGPQTQSLQIFPNPATDELNITLDNNSYKSYTITNTLGQVLVQQGLSGMQATADIRSLARGLYYVNLKGSNGVVTRNFVKK